MAQLKDLIVNGPSRFIGDVYATTFTGNLAGNASTATNATNAGMIAGLSIHSGRNNEANKIVRTDRNGYLQVGYINSSSGHEKNASSPTYVWGSNSSDSYLRSYQTSSLSVKYATTSGSCSGNAATATDADTLDGYHASSFSKTKLIALPVGQVLCINVSDWTRGLLISMQGSNGGRNALYFVTGYGDGTIVRNDIRVIKGGPYDLYFNGTSEKACVYIVGTSKNTAANDNIYINPFDYHDVTYTIVSSVPSDAVLVSSYNSNILATLNSNVASASKWATARTITLTGSVTGSVSIDGSANVSLVTTTNHTHNYLPLSGGTITSEAVAPLALKSTSSSGHSILQFISGETYLGALGFKGLNDPYFRTAEGTFNTLIHSGNIRSQVVKGLSMNYVNNLDNATIGELFSSDFKATNIPSTNYATGLTIYNNQLKYNYQLAFNTYAEVFVRYKDSSAWQSWKQIAFTDSNVASATKLQNSRTIWGQSFDGTQNVSGVLSDVNQVTFDANKTYGIFRGDWYSSALTRDDLAFSVPRAVFGGDVGIGTSSPSYKLDVNGTLRVTDATTLASTLNVSGRATIAEGITSKGLHDFLVYGDEFNFIPDSYSGVVGINTRTASSNLNGNVTEYLFRNGAGAYSDIRCKNLYATGGTLTIGSATMTWNDSALIFDKSTRFRLDTFLDNWAYLRTYLTDGTTHSLIGVNNSDMLCINDGTTIPTIIRGGKVGIGTSSPSYKLHVVGDGYFTENVIIESNFSSRGNATIDGYVGIGMQNPAYNLDVDGNMRITGPIWLNMLNSNEKYFISTEYNGLLGITYDGRYQNPAFLMNSSGYVYLNCDIPGNPAYPLVVNGTISCTKLLQTSDIKYKTNIKQIEYEEALKIIENLNPVTWDWNENTVETGSSSGFVAQEAEEFIPNAISRDNENNLSLDYTQLHSYEIKVIQEQQKEIIKLKEKLKILEKLIS